MSKQVLSIEQMQHLKELGVDISKAYMCWVCLNSAPYLSFYSKKYPHEDTKVISAFTLQDILDLLPATVDDYILYIDKGLVLWTVGYVDAVSEEIYGDFRERDLIDAAYEMLCWVIDNGYLNVK